MLLRMTFRRDARLARLGAKEGDRGSTFVLARVTGVVGLVTVYNRCELSRASIFLS